MSVFNEITSRKHENITIVQDSSVGLTAIIAVHSTAIGPALGGCRMSNYKSLDDALFDVSRLSEAMTFKNALCGINFGGGKSVIVADREIEVGRRELFESFARAVKNLNGSYIAAEDMGTRVSDMEIIKSICPFVAGNNPNDGGGGDPSPFTALGVFSGMRACLERVFNSGDFKDKRVAIQGVGNVGYYLAKFLAEAGARLIIADSRQKHLERIAAEFEVEICSKDEILSKECDILAPCAVGGVLNEQSVPKLNCKIIAGAANNQLLNEKAGEDIARKGIIYAPDFAINAGGVILCADEFEPGGFSKTRVEGRVKEIYGTVERILDKSYSTQKLPGVIAREVAQERILSSERPK